VADPEHIAGPTKRVIRILEVVYSGNNYDRAIDAELRRLGLRYEDVRVIIAIPCAMQNDNDCQLKLFDKPDADKRQR
jgi:hypothetical protein